MVKGRSARRLNPKKIAFGEEIVTKDNAQQIIKTKKEEEVVTRKHQGDEGTLKLRKQKKQRSKKSEKQEEESTSAETMSSSNIIEPIEPSTNETSKEPKRKKRKKTDDESNVEDPDVSATIEDGTEEALVEKKEQKESIRARKRRKFAELQEEKRLQSELASQEKSLNYLSKWKHSRSEWKFEKLRQIWLQQNVYDEAKIPESFWHTLLEYFTNSKGKSRDVILQEALKIVEEDTSEETKLVRARDIIQNLQE